MSAILSFLGGSAFRMIWGEAVSFLNKKQDHRQQLDLLRTQEQNDQAAHARTLEMLTKQQEFKVQGIKIQTEGAIDLEGAKAFTAAMAEATKPTGIGWLDAWRGSVRPSAATVAMAIWIGCMWQSGWVITEWDQQLVASIFGYYFADRSLGKRGK